MAFVSAIGFVSIQIFLVIITSGEKNSNNFWFDANEIVTCFLPKLSLPFCVTFTGFFWGYLEANKPTLGEMLTLIFCVSTLTAALFKFILRISVQYSDFEFLWFAGISLNLGIPPLPTNYIYIFFL